MKSLITCINLSLFLFISGCRADGQETLDSKGFKTKIALPGAQVIDIRTGAEFSNGYIEGAKNIDFYQRDFVQNVSQLDKEKPLAIYCKSGGRTKDALKMLANEGFKSIYALKGGLLAWENAGYTLVTPKPVEPVLASVTKSEFDKLIASEHIVIIEFGATWCGPCKMLKPILDKISADYAKMGIKIITIDVDDSKALSNELRVNDIPLLLFYKDGLYKEQMLGFNPEVIIKESIDKYLKP